jgi:beta-lactamase class A
VPLLVVALLGTPAGAGPRGSEPPWPAVLEQGVEAAARDFHGELSLYVRDVRTGAEYAHGAEAPMYLSSAIKVAVMLEVLRQVDAGTLALDTPVLFEPEDVRDGMSPLAKVAPGTRLPVATLLEYMMVYSDNAAADLLLARVGLDNVQAHLEARGVRFGPLVTLLDDRRRVYAKLDPRGAELSSTQVRELGTSHSLASRARHLSELLGQSPPWTGSELHAAFMAYYAEGTNSASMKQVGLLLDQLARCEGLSPTSCERALALMRSCRTGRGRILAGLPAGADWAHKTGTQHQRACDVGILHVTPDRPMVVAVCTKGFRQVSEAEALMARIGRTLTEAFLDTEAPAGGYSAPP